MLNKDDLRQYRMLRDLSYREVSNYCNVSHTLISQVEKGERGLTLETHNEIVNGINLAYDTKCKGTLKAENTRKPKADTIDQDVQDSAQVVKADTPNLVEVQNNRTDNETKSKRTTKKKSTKTSN